MNTQMTPARIDALVASAFNIAAADDASIRRVHPNGMSPAVAAELPKAVRLGWVECYARRFHAGELKQHEPLLYGALEIQAALDALRAD